MSDLTREEAIEHLEDMKKGLFLWDMTELIDLCISALSEELSEDGTLTVHVKDGSKVNRVFVMGDNIFGGLYYPDSDFEGMTNGEVFRAIYPNVAMVHDVREGKRLSVFADDWWNAPYKGVSK